MTNSIIVFCSYCRKEMPAEDFEPLGLCQKCYDSGKRVKNGLILPYGHHKNNQKEYFQRYYVFNRGLILEKARSRYEINGVEMKAKALAYYYAHREKVLAREKAKYPERRRKLINRTSSYYQQNKEAINFKLRNKYAEKQANHKGVY